MTNEATTKPDAGDAGLVSNEELLSMFSELLRRVSEREGPVPAARGAYEASLAASERRMIVFREFRALADSPYQGDAPVPRR